MLNYKKRNRKKTSNYGGVQVKDEGVRTRLCYQPRYQEGKGDGVENVDTKAKNEIKIDETSHQNESFSHAGESNAILQRSGRKREKAYSTTSSDSGFCESTSDSTTSLLISDYEEKLYCDGEVFREVANVRTATAQGRDQVLDDGPDKDLDLPCNINIKKEEVEVSNIARKNRRRTHKRTRNLDKKTENACKTKSAISTPRIERAEEAVSDTRNSFDSGVPLVLGNGGSARAKHRDQKRIVTAEGSIQKLEQCESQTRKIGDPLPERCKIKRWRPTRSLTRSDRAKREKAPSLGEGIVMDKKGRETASFDQASEQPRNVSSVDTPVNKKKGTKNKYQRCSRSCLVKAACCADSSCNAMESHSQCYSDRTSDHTSRKVSSRHIKGKVSLPTEPASSIDTKSLRKDGNDFSKTGNCRVKSKHRKSKRSYGNQHKDFVQDELTSPGGTGLNNKALDVCKTAPLSGCLKTSEYDTSNEIGNADVSNKLADYNQIEDSKTNCKRDVDLTQSTDKETITNVFCNKKPNVVKTFTRRADNRLPSWPPRDNYLFIMEETPKPGFKNISSVQDNWEEDDTLRPCGPGKSPWSYDYDTNDPQDLDVITDDVCEMFMKWGMCSERELCNYRHPTCRYRDISEVQPNQNEMSFSSENAPQSRTMSANSKHSGRFKSSRKETYATVISRPKNKRCGAQMEVYEEAWPLLSSSQRENTNNIRVTSIGWSRSAAPISMITTESPVIPFNDDNKPNDTCQAANDEIIAKVVQEQEFADDCGSECSNGLEEDVQLSLFEDNSSQEQLFLDQYDQESLDSTGSPYQRDNQTNQSKDGTGMTDIKAFSIEQSPADVQLDNRCEICMDAEKDATLLCGHRFCYLCAHQMRLDERQCAICRRPIVTVIKTFN